MTVSRWKRADISWDTRKWGYRRDNDEIRYEELIHDVTSAILVSQNNKTGAMLVSQNTESCGIFKLLSFVNSFLGPVQTSCFCRAELNSGLSSTKARRLNQTFELSSASAAVLHGSGTAAIQTSCFCRAKQNS